MPNLERIGQPQSSRAKDLSDFIRDEIERFRAGEITRISTNEELRERFGYTQASTFYPTLKREGLLEERKKIKEQGGQTKEGQETIIPSYEWAWMIGILAGGGHVNPKGQISTYTSDDDFLQVTRSVGTRLFEENPTVKELRKSKDGTSYRMVSFYSTKLARQIGDLRRDKYPETIIEKHPWILKDQKYIVGLLSGVFDTRGFVSESQQSITFLTSFPNVTSFISELLVRAGIKKPTVKYSQQGKKVMGVGIYNIADRKKLAEIIYSRVPAKQSKLDGIRKKESKGRGSDDDVIDEWLNLIKILGHVPNSVEITRLKKEGKTRFSLQVYMDRFGKERDRKSFLKVRERLMAITEISDDEKITDKTEVARQAKPQKEMPRKEKKASKPKKLEKAKSVDQLFEEYMIARAISLRDLGRLPRIKDFSELKRRGIITRTAHTIANYFGRRSFPLAVENLEIAVKERLGSGRYRKYIEEKVLTRLATLEEAVLPNERNVGRPAKPKQEVPQGKKERKGWKRVESPDELVAEYEVAREVCIKEKGRLPTIWDIDDLIQQGLVQHTAHTLANYFGNRSYPKARKNLERIIAEREAEKSDNESFGSQETQIFP